MSIYITSLIICSFIGFVVYWIYQHQSDSPKSTSTDPRSHFIPSIEHFTLANGKDAKQSPKFRMVGSGLFRSVEFQNGDQWVALLECSQLTVHYTPLIQPQLFVPMTDMQSVFASYRTVKECLDHNIRQLGRYNDGIVNYANSVFVHDM